MKKGKLNILVGVAGCGKSTYINSVKKEDDVVISSDDIREEIYGDAENQQNAGLVFSIFHGRIADALVKGKTVWADATSLSKIARKDFYKYAKGFAINSHIIVASLEKCKEQNNSRSRKVPNDVIERMYNNIELPNNEPTGTIVVRNIDGKYIITKYNGETYEELVRSE